MLSKSRMQKIFIAENISRCLRYCCLPALLFFSISMIVLTLSGFSTLEILRDSAQITKTSSFLGFLSSVGSWLWVAGATICLFRIATLDRNSNNQLKKLLHLIGWFSLFLAVDDFFLIHDRYITEGILFPLYAIYLIYLLIRHHTTIVEVDGFAFLLAGSFLALSVFVDAVQEIIALPYAYNQILEEGFKFLGGATWLFFCYRLGSYRLQETHAKVP